MAYIVKITKKIIEKEKTILYINFPNFDILTIVND